jgi:hypothetical protein
MTYVEAHRQAAKIADYAIKERYNADTFSCGSEVHAYWLSIYDAWIVLLTCRDRQVEED